MITVAIGISESLLQLFACLPLRDDSTEAVMQHFFFPFFCLFLVQMNCPSHGLKVTERCSLRRLTACRISRDSCENRCDRKVVRTMECSYLFHLPFHSFLFFLNFPSFLLSCSDCVENEVFWEQCPKCLLAKVVSFSWGGPSLLLFCRTFVKNGPSGKSV